MGFRVFNFCIQDSPRRAHSIAAQGGINAVSYTHLVTAQAQKPNNEALRKLQMAEFAITNLYVDKVDEDKLVEEAIIKMLDVYKRQHRNSPSAYPLLSKAVQTLPLAMWWEAIRSIP